MEIKYITITVYVFFKLNVLPVLG